ncbi:lectin c-type domain-containing protein [Ditylenchus destructor]|nr:lectin c-type domain-containing protein [Ditylenchus destructor]
MTSARNQSSECPDKWLLHNEKCFRKFNESKSFDNAEKQCEDVHGGILAVFRDEKEFDFIVTSFQSHDKDDSWIGLNHSETTMAAKGKMNRFKLTVAGTMKDFNFTFPKNTSRYGKYWHRDDADGWEPNGSEKCEGRKEGMQRCVMMRLDGKMADECCSLDTDPGEVTTPSTDTTPNTTPSASAMPQPFPGGQGQYPVPGQYPIAIPYPIDETIDSCWLTLLGLGEELCPRKK